MRGKECNEMKCKRQIPMDCELFENMGSSALMSVAMYMGRSGMRRGAWSKLAGRLLILWAICCTTHKDRWKTFEDLKHSTNWSFPTLSSSDVDSSSHHIFSYSFPPPLLSSGPSRRRRGTGLTDSDAFHPRHENTYGSTRFQNLTNYIYEFLTCFC